MSGLLSERNIERIGLVCGWAAAILLLFTMLTGYGISEFRAVTRFTFGILDKATSQRLHHYTDIPLLIFLSVHVGLAFWRRLGRRDEGVD
jgi:cytochrome b subunit of formate dehydrogenase